MGQGIGIGAGREGGVDGGGGGERAGLEEEVGDVLGGAVAQAVRGALAVMGGPGRIGRVVQSAGFEQRTQRGRQVTPSHRVAVEGERSQDKDREPHPTILWDKAKKPEPRPAGAAPGEV